ncbi:FBD-associated F-box protein At5g38590-like [Lotus japonicus]|uniref:FBD-associated F-box protein At5g38590-like n=1 Tax=Lotus japonicus TaxID=34305 RepID=UPI00258AF7E8|nr:FBD-associated F-box protein At5g38590-like [Lotus japonicus]
MESLDLSLASEVSLSCRVFRCKTLVVLKLSCLSIFGRSSVQLPSLKTLHLVNVVLGQPKYLMKFLYGLPMLEDLKVHCLQYTEDFDDSFFKEEFKSLPKLISADLLSMKECPDFPLEAICNAESLTIRENGLDKVVCVFPNLIHVVITFVSGWNFVFEMLKNCPKLQVFELVLYGYPPGALIYPDVVPPCLTSHLTKCSLEQYIGTEVERQFAKYIMQNSTTLRTMTISSYLRSLQLRYAMVDELTLCPRISPLCELSFKYLSDY